MADGKASMPPAEAAEKLVKAVDTLVNLGSRVRDAATGEARAALEPYADFMAEVKRLFAAKTARETATDAGEAALAVREGIVNDLAAARKEVIEAAEALRSASAMMSLVVGKRMPPDRKALRIDFAIGDEDFAGRITKACSEDSAVERMTLYRGIVADIAKDVTALRRKAAKLGERVEAANRAHKAKSEGRPYSESDITEGVAARKLYDRVVGTLDSYAAKLTMLVNLFCANRRENLLRVQGETERMWKLMADLNLNVETNVAMAPVTGVMDDIRVLDERACGANRRVKGRKG